MPQNPGFATNTASGFASGFTLPQQVIFTPSEDVGRTIALGVTTYQTSIVTPFATAFGGFFAFTGLSAGTISLDVVLQAIVDTITGAEIVAPACATISLTSEPFPAAGGPVAVVIPGAFTIRDSHQVGIGRSLATEDGGFTVQVATLAGQDIKGQDPILLLTATTGLLSLAHQIKNLLNTRFVVDSVGKILSIEPVFYRSQSRPKPFADDPTWVGIDLEFSLSFVGAMTGGA